MQQIAFKLRWIKFIVVYNCKYIFNYRMNSHMWSKNSLHLVSSLPSVHSRVPLQRPEKGIHWLPVVHRNELPEHETLTKVQTLVILWPQWAYAVRAKPQYGKTMKWFVPRKEKYMQQPYTYLRGFIVTNRGVWDAQSAIYHSFIFLLHP